MIIIGLTPDLARHLVEMIDGKADAREGMFRQQGVANDTAAAIGGGTPGSAGIEWNSDNTNQFGSFGGENLDEDQVAVVTAQYKMNQ